MQRVNNELGNNRQCAPERELYEYSQQTAALVLNNIYVSEP